MRIFLRFGKNIRLIPFNYQSFLTGAIHKWLGIANGEHGSISLYSFSWFQNIIANTDGINFTNDSYFFISAHNDEIIKKIINGVMADSSLCFGSYITDIQIAETPIFSSSHTFYCASPIFIKRKIENEEKHITFMDSRSSEYLTETLKTRLNKAGLSTEAVQVEFDASYNNSRTKLIHYKGIANKANICPINISGSPEQIAFAWNVGVGNSTGIGFGALK